jgi:hypothetical protein
MNLKKDYAKKLVHMGFPIMLVNIELNSWAKKTEILDVSQI